MTRAAAALSLFLLSCTGVDTGVILEISAPGTLPIDHLQVVIGVHVDGRYVRDPRSSVTLDVSGRDLAADPYRLLVTDGLTGDGTLATAIIAYGLGEGPPLGVATLAPFAFADGDVLLHRLEVGALGDLAITETGCVAFAGTVIASPDDRDCDAVSPPADCDDLDPAVSTFVSEVCDNGRDDDCDGRTDERDDIDRDGHDICDDCDDRAQLVFPGAAELCDNKDNDCDGLCDEGHDKDGDGLTICGSRLQGDGTCTPGTVGDCLDDDPTSGAPGSPERCDGKDNDCDGLCDELPDLDHDGDGFTTCGTFASEPVGAQSGHCGQVTTVLRDCRDDAAVHPFQHEVCDGLDDNCDGVLLASAPCFGPAARCALGTRSCDDDASDGASGFAAACVADAPELLVASPLCDAYAGAACAASTDPFRCAAAAAATWKLDCRLAMRRTIGVAGATTVHELCPDGRLALPTAAAATGCRFTLVGGMNQEQLIVGLGRATGLPGPTLADCAGFLRVLELEVRFAPQPDELVILYDDAVRADHAVVHVRVTPRIVEACPPSPLECTMR